MRRTAWWAAAVLAAAAAAWAQVGPVGPSGLGGPGATELTCPLDGYHFAPASGGFGDRAGGLDSDGCAHSLGEPWLTAILVVCPRCNYAAMRGEFARDIPEGKRAALLRMLVKSHYRGVADGVRGIPPWERYRLAAQCAEVLERPEERLDCVKYAAWSARIEACRSASAAYSNFGRFVTPLPQQMDEYGRTSRGVADVLREIDRKIAAAAAPDEKNRLKLHLAAMLERAGFAAKRDAVLAALDAAAPADPSLAALLNRFRKCLAVEREFQEQVVELLRERLKKDESRTARAQDLYVLADTLRRLGRDAEAVTEYRAARRLMSEPIDMRTYVDHFLSMLAPGEPLPVPEKAPEPAAPALAPVMPAPAPEAPKPAPDVK